VLKLGWAEVAQAGMKTLTVVPKLNELEDMSPGLISGGKSVPGTFGLESPEEAFDHGVVKAIADATHADSRLDPSEVILVGLAGILGSLVRMMQQAIAGASAPNRHLQRIFDQAALHVLGHRPPDNSSAEQVQNSGQVQPALTRVDVRDVRNPLLVRPLRSEVLGQQVRPGGHIRSTLSSGRPASMRRNSHNPAQTHQPRHPVTATGHPALLQSGMHARAAICPLALGMHLTYLLHKLLIGLLAGADRPLAPGIACPGRRPG